MSIRKFASLIFLVLCLGATPWARAEVIEYYSPTLDNYFLTADPAEQAMVDAGGAGDWRRTGGAFGTGGAAKVCRFYGNTALNPATGAIFGPNSHFYTADAGECSYLRSLFDPLAMSWRLEAEAAFQTTPAQAGACSGGTLPVYRAYNRSNCAGVSSICRPQPNHRISTDAAAIAEVVARGWVSEGVVMCAPGVASPPQADAWRVEAVSSSYRAASGGRSGWLASGQSADVLLSGYGFGISGGPLVFNHPRAIASDGTRLLVSDGHNNRVLVWRQAPDGNIAPDFALGQTDLVANVPGTGLAQMNWPGQVSVSADGKVVVADTYNDRILVWRSFPSSSGQPADFEIRNTSLRWPWGAWTDGTRLVASSTGTGQILVWSSFPAHGSSSPSFILSDAAIGTPRTITSDGSFLIVGDHNAYQTQAGNWVWKTFPTSARPFDFFLREPSDGHGPWQQGAVAPNGKLIMLGRYLNLWDSPPGSADTPPSLIVKGFPYRGGDGSGVAFAAGRTYVVAYNDNRVTGYRSDPVSASARPDFSLGSPSLEENTLTSGYFITNPVPATDGTRLYVSSDFDRSVSVWTALPDESAAKPNWRYTAPFAPWDNALWKGRLVLAGQRQIAVWSQAPSAGELPDREYKERIGSVSFQEIRGVALDDHYFYVGDSSAGKIYVWQGLPDANDEPLLTLTLPGVTRLSSDGNWLAATLTEAQSVAIYAVASLASTPSPVTVGGAGSFNLPQGARLAQGGLYVASTNFNQVHAWRRVEDAIAGQPADAILGSSERSAPPRNTADGLFWPGVPAFDGSYLWLGEFKFSGRLLRFSVR